MEAANSNTNKTIDLALVRECLGGCAKLCAALVPLYEGDISEKAFKIRQYNKRFQDVMKLFDCYDELESYIAKLREAQE